MMISRLSAYLALAFFALQSLAPSLASAPPGDMPSPADPTILVSMREDLADEEVIALLARHGIGSEAVRPTRVHGLWRIDLPAAGEETRSRLMAALAPEPGVQFVSPARVENPGWLTALGQDVIFEAKPAATPEMIIRSIDGGAGIDLDSSKSLGSDQAYSLRVDSKNRSETGLLAERLSGDSEVVWSSAQTFTIPDDGLVYIVPQEAVDVQRYSDGSRAKLPSEERWRLMCGSQPMEFDAFRAMVNELRAAPPPANVATSTQNVAGAGFDLVFSTSNIPPAAIPAIAAVEAYLEGIIFDPITVQISLGFASMSPGVLGATSSSYTSDSYADVRAGLVAGMDFDDTIQTELPPGNTFPVRYNGNADTITNEAVVFVTRANYRATVGSSFGSAGSMTFNTNFSWDYSPPVSGGTWCFQSVLAHEVGHALGFVSGADFRFNDSEMLDLYRFQNSDGSFNYNPDTLADFATTPRLVDQNAPGTFDDVVSDVISAEWRMSDGDPNQASHFREGVPAVMDPTLAAAQTFFPDLYRVADQTMFDAIGYDIFTDAVPLLTPATDGIGSELAKNRSISFVIPASGSGQDTAVRVELLSVHHPAGPANAPDLTAFEGQFRYLNSFRDGSNDPVFNCPDSAAYGTTYKCALLGCEPEYRDWAAAFGGAVVHVFGSAVVPSSQYGIAHLASSCAGNELACTEGWAELTVSTERWGNVDASPAGGAPSALDLALIVDRTKDLMGALIEPRSQLQPAMPNPLTGSVTASDIARAVDAVKGAPYPFTITTCP